MTAREIIEAGLGRKWPATRDLAPDQRQAIKLLAIELIKNKRRALERSIEIQKKWIANERDSYNRDTMRRVLEGWEKRLREMQ